MVRQDGVVGGAGPHGGLQPAKGAFEVTATPLPNGPERDAVIRATAEQQPFPDNLVYRAARRHILSEGRYFRLEPA